jgi:hypothetical protein
MDELSPIELLQQGPNRTASRGPLCPDVSLLAAFTDGGLTEAERADFRDHLADCGHCLRAVSLLVSTEAAHTFETVPPELQARAGELRRRWQPAGHAPRWSWAAAAVLVASVSLVLLRSAPDVTTESTVPEERFLGLTSGAPSLLFPESGATLRPNGARFRWTEVAGAVSYTVRVVSLDGEVLFEQTVFETGADLPSTVRLQPGETYFVRVSALLSGGKRLDSEHLRFLVEGAN